MVGGFERPMKVAIGEILLRFRLHNGYTSIRVTELNEHREQSDTPLPLWPSLYLVNQSLAAG